MADFNNAIMTIGGAALLAAATAGTARIKFVKLVTGSGSYTESEKNRGNLQTCVGLKAPMQEIPFSSISMASETCVKLVALVSNAMLEVGYYVNEVGIYAVNEMDTVAEPILYSIAIANIADYLPPYNGLAPATITQEYFATVDNALEVIIQTNSEALALAADLDALSKKVENMLDEVFQSGNETKKKFVEHLIAKGIEASTEDTWEVLLDKVLNMTNTSGDTVTAAVLLEGYTAHNAAGEQITGIIPERAGVTVDAVVSQDDTYTYMDIPAAGYYDENSKLRSANSNLAKEQTYVFESESLGWEFKFGYPLIGATGNYKSIRVSLDRANNGYTPLTLTVDGAVVKTLTNETRFEWDVDYKPFALAYSARNDLSKGSTPKTTVTLIP